MVRGAVVDHNGCGSAQTEAAPSLRTSGMPDSRSSTQARKGRPLIGVTHRPRGGRAELRAHDGHALLCDLGQGVDDLCREGWVSRKAYGEMMAIGHEQGWARQGT